MLTERPSVHFPSALFRVMRANRDLRGLLGTSGTGAKYSLMSLGTRLKVHDPSGSESGSSLPLHLLYPLLFHPVFLLSHPPASSSLAHPPPLPSPAFLLLLLWEQQTVSRGMEGWMGHMGRVWLQTLFACQVAAFVSVMQRSVGYHSNQETGHPPKQSP